MRSINWIFGLYVGALPLLAFPWAISTPQSEPCHERITLGALDALSPPFSSSSDTDTTALFDALKAKLGAVGVPTDSTTRGFIDENVRRYGLQRFNLEEQFILASIVAGTRNPDTDGLATLKFNETRSVHIREELQNRHTLRKSEHDGDAGAQTAISDARTNIIGRVREAHRKWSDPTQYIADARWTFAFYGETNVKVFQPAFLLGEALHTIQDSYAHTIRNSGLSILTVLNYVDVVRGRHDEARDGPAHSERLDLCDMNNGFDRMRFDAARLASADFLEASETVLNTSSFSPSPVNIVLDSIYDYVSGCNHTNAYCHSEWYEKARESFTEPISVSLCFSSASAAGFHARPTAGFPAFLSWVPLWILFLWGVLRLNFRRRKAEPC